MEAELLKLKMAELEAALLQELPEMRVILKDIHDALKEDPENVTILSDEERGIIIRGLKRSVNEEIAVSSSKKPTTAAAVKKSMKNKSEDDILKMLGGGM